MITKLFIQIKKRKFTSGIAFLLIVGIGYWGYGSLFSQDGVVRYASAQVQKGTLSVSVNGTGNVVADETADINSDITGTVTELKVSLGDKVEKGKALIVIKNDELGVQETSALVALNQAKEDVEKARLDKQEEQEVLDELRQKDIDDPSSVSDLEIKQQEQKVRATDLAIESKEVKVQSATITYDKAKNDAAKRTVKSPLSGVVTALNVKVEDELKGSSKAENGDQGQSTNSLITVVNMDKLVATVSLNEVDVAKVKVGQKATMTFDAVPDLTMTGQVKEIDTLGTISQGVVTYNAKIAFDTQDDRVKPGISVSASIITEAKPDVLLVPNSAVKSQGGVSYVEIPDESDMSVATVNVSGAIFQNPTRQQQIEIGTANDEFTEIVSGLNEGDLVVTRTIQPTAAAQTQTQSGGLRIPGLNTGGGGATRTGGGFQH